MLKFSINKNLTEKNTEIFPEIVSFNNENDTLEIFLSQNVVDENDEILINGFYENDITVNAKVEEYIVLGIVYLDTTYHVYHDINLDDNISFIKDKNGLYYYNYSGDTTHIYVDNIPYEITDDSIIVTEPYLITSETLTAFDNKVYDIFISRELNKDHVLVSGFIEYNGKEIDCKKNLFKYPEKWYKVTLDVSFKNNLNIYSAACANLVTNVQYSGETYEVLKTDDGTDYYIVNDSASTDFSSVTIHSYFDEQNGGLYLLLRDSNMPSYNIHDLVVAEKIYDIDNTKESIFFTKNDGSIIECFNFGNDIYDIKEQDENGIYYDFVEIDGNEYEINYAKKGDTYGYIEYKDSVIHINLTNSLSVVKSYYNSLDINSLSKEKYYDLIHEKIKYNNNAEYDIFYSSGLTNCYAYKTLPHMNISKNVSDSTTNYLLSNPVYGVKRYKFVEINGVKYKVEVKPNQVGVGDNSTVLYQNTLKLPLVEKYIFYIISNKGIEDLICTPLINDRNKLKFTLNYGIGSDEFARFIVKEVQSNFNDYSFSIKYYPSLLENGYHFNENIYNNSGFSYNELYFYKNLDYICVPIVTDQEIGTNINQEDLLENLFKGTETSNSINSIIDMDKDVYYPFYLNDDNLNEVEKITIDLHFRTRNLDTWKQYEDYSNINGLNDSNLILPIFDSARTTNWFCTDMYSSEYIQKSCKKSDLLYFLNFTNDDVFYQKSKIGKSFIRLLFYDSMNPADQSLVYQATIWLDEHLLYKKYINNIENDNYHDIINDIDVKHIGVSYEPYDEDGFTFNTDDRLDCHFIISNRYETNDSAEGFYLYLFKNMTEGVCPSKLYMKVMFNHAGEGKSCLFMLPKKNGETIKDFNSENLTELKHGVKIQDISKNVYIPLTIKYDDNKNKYIYYFDSNDINIDNDTNEINFNLFEIKLQDESNK